MFAAKTQQEQSNVVTPPAHNQHAPSPEPDREWVHWAIGRIEADFNRSADTHLLPVPVPALPDIGLYLKDESSHPTGSLKHRLARSLFLYALSNGWLQAGRPVIEASSGSTAVSEAYFARMLGLPFIAVVPVNTAPEKLHAIEALGGTTHPVEAGRTLYAVAEDLARSLGGHYMDQFTYAERATDWRGNNNIAEAIYAQMAREPHPVPTWVVCGAGTGGTSATIGRFARYHRHITQICVADPEASVFHRHWHDRSIDGYEGPSSLIEGIGRPRVEPSFIPGVVDRMIVVSDAQSIAAARAVSRRLGKLCGGSTGTNVWACAVIASELARAGQAGSMVSILCDSGERYRSSYFDDAWIAQKGLDLAPYEAAIERFFDTGSIG
ncbi:MAG: PLP-dependent cysteine synthase family protein [Proteobacteria bacterium]|nr:PLP-dependent cysteine synthase family protein [Pseudomonadota bacterium]